VMAAQFETLAPAAEGADAVVATGLFPATAGAQSVAEKLGVRYVYAAYAPIFLPSPRNRPHPLPGRTVPEDVTDPERLNEIDIENYNAAFGPLLNGHRAAIGLPPVDNVRDHVITDHPWLAADPVLAPADPGLVQTGAWRVDDERPLPDDLERFLDAGTPPIYVGFGSMKGRADIVDAVRAGVPQVVVPPVADQPYFARRVAELGIGVAYDGSLEAALETALAPSTKARAAAVAPTIRTDGAMVAAKLLVDADRP
jgi:vancomycin aglycone glucosyltransferase